jgi:hypothetical protein
MRINTCLHYLVIVSLLGTTAFAQSGSPNPEKELNNRLKERYDGRTLVVAVAGLLAGEYRKSEIGIGRVVAAAFSSGASAAEVAAIGSSMRFSDVARWTISRMGLLAVIA